MGCGDVQHLEAELNATPTPVPGNSTAGLNPVETPPTQDDPISSPEPTAISYWCMQPFQRSVAGYMVPCTDFPQSDDVVSLIESDSFSCAVDRNLQNVECSMDGSPYQIMTQITGATGMKPINGGDPTPITVYSESGNWIVGNDLIAVPQ